MKKLMLMSCVMSCALAGAMVIGCEEGESAGDATKRVVDNAADATGDALKGAGEAVKDTGAAIADKSGEAAQAVTDAAIKAKDATVKAAEDKLAEIRPKVDAWAQKAASATGLDKPVMDNLVKNVQDGMSGVETKLGELRNAAADQWEAIAKELGTAMSGLESAVKAAAAKFGA